MFEIKTISAKELDEYVGRPDVLVIDLRSADEYARSHLRGALSLPYDESEENGFAKARLPREKLLIFYCDRGGASMKTASDMARLGYRTGSVIGGFESYRGRNLVISG